MKRNIALRSTENICASVLVTARQHCHNIMFQVDTDAQVCVLTPHSPGLEGALYSDSDFLAARLLPVHNHLGTL
jgi:hypothetical protein